jgi:hypothetical protein
VAASLIREALKGNIAAMKEIADRIDGKVPLQQVITGDEDGGPARYYAEVTRMAESTEARMAGNRSSRPRRIRSIQFCGIEKPCLRDPSHPIPSIDRGELAATRIMYRTAFPATIHWAGKSIGDYRMVCFSGECGRDWTSAHPARHPWRADRHMGARALIEGFGRGGPLPHAVSLGAPFLRRQYRLQVEKALERLIDRHG